MASTRRQFIRSSAAVAGAAVLLPGAAGARPLRRVRRIQARPDLLIPDADQMAALQVLGRTTMRAPGSLPNPALAAGTDTMPGIEHVVVLMMENHSYDNLFGMLGRGPFQVPRGDGFTISAADGYPLNTNPQADGPPLRAFPMPTDCQLSGKPSQEWTASHEQYDGGKNDGFVTSPSGPVAMGYWDSHDIPFTYDLASTFPVGDRWFCSLLGQTDPNRRFLLAGTAMGMTDDIPDPSQDGPFGLSPPNGTIFTQLTQHGISWYEYASDTSATGESGNLYPEDDYPLLETHGKPFSQFLTDAAAGNLPSFSFLDPNYGTQSQEDPQNVAIGEAFLRSAVEAVGKSPKWRQTIMIITYDEHGGYYDHVPPPVALAPDDIPPTVNPGESTYDAYKRYGFRVPSLVVGPYAKPHYVSHVVYDHTSVLAFLERKFNLPAMTLRDANANDLTDFLDLGAMAAGRPTFPEMPALAPAASGAVASCSIPYTAKIPPPRPAALPLQVSVAYEGIHSHGARLRLQASRGTVSGLKVELIHRGKVVSERAVGPLTVVPREVVLRVHGHRPAPGRYSVAVRQGTRVLAHRSISVR